MSSQKTGSFQGMKSLNRSIILNSIRVHGMISRSEIAKETRLTPPTVTNIVAELILANLVVERRPGTSNGGRKPILLAINADSRFIIGVDVGVKKVRLALTNLNAEVSLRRTEELPSGLNEGEFLLFLKEIVSKFKQEIEKGVQEKIIGIGVAMHGIVDHTSGIAIHAPTLKLENVPVKEALEETFSLPVRVENDAKALALGEKWFGVGKDMDHFFCLNVGEGIGGGLVQSGQLVHGNDSLAGEIGHTVVDLRGPVCSCGNRGCLEAFSSGNALKFKGKQLMNAGKAPKLTEKLRETLSPISGKIIYECAVEGDTVSREILEEAGEYLGIGILNLIHLINPQMIILGGGVSQASDFLLKPINEVVSARALSDRAKKTEIVVSKLGEEGSLIGAVTLVLSELFSHEY
ncbi:ROK family transcriptional regulator [Salipaludibacillus sp. CF4.18]|uniref:ROK family transcriptional regulator n=1 Tax=Salipaludibacillus sp. CF4.18 TaxID=3373081 RepID=UPI003EE5C119